MRLSEAYSSFESANKKWFALYVKPRHEKVVVRSLDGVGLESFLPLYVRRHVYACRRKENEIPLFPGYVFCRFDPFKRTPILSTPGVISIVSVARTPVPVDDIEIFSLRSAIKAQLPLERCGFVETGHRVRIIHGALSGIEGIVLEVRNSLRLVLSITLLQRLKRFSTRAGNVPDCAEVLPRTQHAATGGPGELQHRLPSLPSRRLQRG